MPTWASGTSERLKSNVGPGRLLDSSKYFVIAVDAFCNGVSSSPSNSISSLGCGSQTVNKAVADFLEQ
ncbi:MAG: hypothetical protein HF312_04585 [Ignavibacteria bacterium]|jgi:homoserine O-acetyltransferase|nr:hypothetical protein [Ignavibacteria bacterium]MCU7519469.1 hypothetical protein [Ignavibacteria bacterium]